MTDYKEKAKKLIDDVSELRVGINRLIKTSLEENGNLFIISEDDIEEISDGDIYLKDEAVDRVHDNCISVRVYPGFGEVQQYVVGMEYVTTNKNNQPYVIYIYGLPYDGGNVLEKYFISDVDSGDLNLLLEVICDGSPLDIKK